MRRQIVSTMYKLIGITVPLKSKLTLEAENSRREDQVASLMIEDREPRFLSEII